MVDSFNMDSPQQPTDPDPVPSAPPASPSSPAQLQVAAVHAHMLAKRTRAVANLNNYLLNSVGVTYKMMFREEWRQSIDFAKKSHVLLFPALIGLFSYISVEF